MSNEKNNGLNHLPITLFEQIVESLPTAVFAKETESFRFVFWNGFSEKLFGYSKDEVLNKTDYDIFPAELADRYRQNDIKVLETRELLDIPEEISHSASGESIILHRREIPIYDEEGSTCYLLVISEDITEQKNAHDSLTIANEAWQDTLGILRESQSKLIEAQKMASLGGLVAGVAHEINTPIGIGVTTASLLDQKISEFQQLYNSAKMKRSDLEKFLDTVAQSGSIISSNLDRAADLVRGFKQVAVDQSSEEKRVFALVPYLEDVILSLRPKLKRLKHHTKIVGDKAIEVESYPGAFSQIATNFIMNSIIHAYDDEDEGNIVFETHLDGREVTVEYTDDGRGIPPENLTKIFEPFLTTKRGDGGSGLGMHIVYNLVTQKLGGNINCESTVGIGTKFTLKLPIANFK